MKPSTGRFSQGVKVLDAGSSIFIGPHTTADVMGRRNDRYGISGDVYPKRQALFMDARKSLPEEISVAVADINVYAVVTALFNLGVYGAGYNVTTGQILEWVVFSHEIMASFVNETSPLATPSPRTASEMRKFFAWG
jgi:hypothetical protein